MGTVRALLRVLLLVMAAESAGAADGAAHVLVLNGVDPYLPTFQAFDMAMRKSLAREAEGRFVFFSEALDAQRFPQDGLEPELVSMLAKKYEGLRIDAVVAVTQYSLDFMRRNGERIWPGARIVYVGFPSETMHPAALPPGTIGVVSHYDVRETIAIARRLQPGARRIIMVSGTSDFDRSMEAHARAMIERIDNPLPVEYITGAPLPELTSRLALEPPTTVVIYLAQFRDRDGRPYTPREFLRAFSANSGAPVYAIAETLVGAGAAAGDVESLDDKGRLVADQVRRTLSGEVSTAMVLDTPSRCVADARALQRWSLDPGRLPDGCEIRYANVPVWRQYLWQIALTLAVIVAQALLLVALYTQHRRRLRAERAEKAQGAELARASRLAMAGELTGAIAHEINQPLGAILSNADAAELMLDSGRDRSDDLRRVLADIRRDDVRASEVIQRLRDLLGKHEHERKVVDLNEVVADLQSLLRTEAGRRGVRLDLTLAPDGPAIRGDRVQIQQVLINLVLNAMDAVAEEAPVRRVVSVSVDKRAHHAVLAVRDRGRGIAPALRTKIFESFFTTKASGMGLGLSITRTIVEAHGGRVWAESRGEGETLFQVELPLATSNADAVLSEA